MHAWQVLEQPVLQHTPSVHWALAHSPATLHAWPSALLKQAPVPSHSWLPHSLSGSVDPVTFAHVPSDPPVFAAVHAWQVLEQPVSQHTPSAHCPLRHSPAPVHAPPSLALQTPPPPQSLPAPHSSSGSADTTTSAQTPSSPPVFAAVHAKQVVSHALSQQTPSTQAPVRHCVLPVQACPLCVLHAPAPSHCCPTPQARVLFSSTQAPDEQEFVVQTLSSSHDLGPPPTHEPLEHLSSSVQKSPSSQPAWLITCSQ